MVAYQAPPSLGFSRQEHWSGLPFPSPMRESESEIAQSCPTLSDPMDCSLPGSSVHGIFQAKGTGVGCHCLLRKHGLSSSILSFWNVEIFKLHIWLKLYFYWIAVFSTKIYPSVSWYDVILLWESILTHHQLPEPLWLIGTAPEVGSDPTWLRPLSDYKGQRALCAAS